MSNADEIDAIVRHLRRELGEPDPAPTAPPPASPAASPDAASVDLCLRDIRSGCGDRADARRFLGELFAPVLLALAIAAAAWLFA